MPLLSKFVKDSYEAKDWLFWKHWGYMHDLSKTSCLLKVIRPMQFHGLCVWLESLEFHL